MSFGKIIVIGGGIGGCAAALALHKAGCQVEIYESAPEFREIGAGINITSAAAGILTQLGLLEALVDPTTGDGVESTVRRYYSPRVFSFTRRSSGCREASRPRSFRCTAPSCTTPLSRRAASASVRRLCT